mmetsp:Transcript_22335/g.41977  ORF Transcript_22335/g.41977 Transcript_22335/m.41977 type:complete len:241 (-) Transcript_22335:475-1197(-)
MSVTCSLERPAFSVKATSAMMTLLSSKSRRVSSNWARLAITFTAYALVSGLGDLARRMIIFMALTLVMTSRLDSEPQMRKNDLAQFSSLSASPRVAIFSSFSTAPTSTVAAWESLWQSRLQTVFPTMILVAREELLSSPMQAKRAAFFSTSLLLPTSLVERKLKIWAQVFIVGSSLSLLKEVMVETRPSSQSRSWESRESKFCKALAQTCFVMGATERTIPIIIKDLTQSCSIIFFSKPT